MNKKEHQKAVEKKKNVYISRRQRLMDENQTPIGSFPIFFLSLTQLIRHSPFLVRFQQQSNSSPLSFSPATFHQRFF